jgi:hypothetical protein
MVTNLMIDTLWVDVIRTFMGDHVGLAHGIREALRRVADELPIGYLENMENTARPPRGIFNLRDPEAVA